jgi:hypothetical protein
MWKYWRFASCEKFTLILQCIDGTNLAGESAEEKFSGLLLVVLLM